MLETDNAVGNDLRAEFLGLGAHEIAQREAVDMGNAGIVIDLGRQDGLPADSLLLDKDGIKQRTLSVKGCRETGGASSDDGKVDDLVILHDRLPSRVCGFPHHSIYIVRDIVLRNINLGECALP